MASGVEMIYPEVRKIAVLRANALGDFIFVLPALEALRAAYPEAEIVYLGRPWHAGFVPARFDSVDRVVVVPVSRGVRDDAGAEEDPAELDRFFAAMAEERFDLALQMHGGGGNSNPFTKRLGARHTAGLRAERAPPLERWVPYVFYTPEVVRYLEVAALVGALPVVFEPRVAPVKEDVAESCAVLPRLGMPLAALHPGAGDPRRRWPPEKFAAVGDALSAAGARVLVLGTPQERPLVEGVLGAMKRPALDLCGKLSLGGLAGLFSRCAVVVANDSGPLHLAGAVGTATVGIYWCGNLITAGHFNRGRHRPFLSWRLDCPVCGQDNTVEVCAHSDSFVAEVPVAGVARAALELFHGRGRHDLRLACACR